MPMTTAAMIVAAFFLSCLLTAGACRLAPCLGLVDQPDSHRKRHGRAMPLMGGAAIFATFAIAAVWLTSVAPMPPADEAAGSVALFPLLASAGLFCLLGLYDDWRALTPQWKLLGQVVACLPFVVWGEAIGKVGILGVQCTLGAWSAPFTVFWLVACSNVINLMDGMDGLAGTICFIALATLGAMAMLMGRYDAVALALLGAASIAGFLVYNWPPAKIFMGDSGSLMLGFLIGALAIQASLKQAAGFMLIMPLVLISVPAFDTAMAILRRKLSGRKIGDGDRGHIHHRLQEQGFSRERSLLLIGGLCTAMSAFCVVALLANSDLLALVLSSALLAALVLARVFGYHEVNLALQHLLAVGRMVTDASRVLPARLLAVRIMHMTAEQRDDCWRQACGCAAQIGGTHLEVCFTDAGNPTVRHRLCWTAPAAATEASEMEADAWQLRHAVRREHGVLATLKARGIMAPESIAKWNETSQLLYALCVHWPLDAVLHADPGEAGRRDVGVIPFDDSLAQQTRAA